MLLSRQRRACAAGFYFSMVLSVLRRLSATVHEYNLFVLYIDAFNAVWCLCVWNCFCSCHGKCVCDSEGGLPKAAADAGDRRSVIRDARELVIFGRTHLSKPVSRDFFSRKTTRAFHFVPEKAQRRESQAVV